MVVSESVKKSDHHYSSSVEFRVVNMSVLKQIQNKSSNCILGG